MADAEHVAGRPSYEDLARLVVELRAELVDARAEIAELRARVSASSRNSSRPPSSDGLAKKPVDDDPGEKARRRSLRRASGKKQGGQQGHDGSRLERVAVPDWIVEHVPECCEQCGSDLQDSEPVGGGESRQVFDIPARRVLEAVEHVAGRRRCRCGHVSAGAFPAGVSAPTVYGPRIRAAGVYLHVFQHLPYDRACQALGDLFAAVISTGTLAGWVAAAAAGLTDFDELLKDLLTHGEVCHFDETGARIAGRLGWIHSASTQKLTRYSAHQRRGSEAIDDAGVLPVFAGVAVHDGWAPYRNYQDCEHGLCNVHHLRELQAAIDAGFVWPVAMSCLLLDTRALVAEAVAAGHARLSPQQLQDLADSYQAVIEAAAAEHPDPNIKGAKTKAHNLLLRLERHQADVLRFAHDFRTPFGNNQAEQDIRMIKLQQKISGCWRTMKGAERFLMIRSYISTARKNGLDAIEALTQLALSDPWLPDPTPS